MPTLTQKGQVTIPKAVRNALKIKQGDEVVFELEEKRVTVRKKMRAGRFRMYMGFLKKKEDADVDALIRRLRDGDG
jgi:AbrB family looped-hinge helix DNA binding protein